MDVKARAPAGWRTFGAGHVYIRRPYRFMVIHSMTVETPPKDIISIQCLRGLASFMVLLFHIQTPLGRLGFHGIYPLGLESGVDIFFVISGFIMWVSTRSAPDRTAADFLINRVIRIVPLYWAVTAFVVLTMLIAPGALKSGRFDLWHDVTSFLFIAHEHPVTHLMQPALVPGWTLNIEMFFYVLFSASMAVGRSFTVRARVLAGLICGAVGLGVLFPRAPRELLFYTNKIILEFLFGAGLGALYVSRSRVVPQARYWWLVVPIGLAALLSGADRILPRIIAFGIPAALIVAGAVFAPPIRTAVGKWMGDISYSLYLTHTVLLSALGQLWAKMHMSNPALFVMLCVVVCVAAAGLTYHLVERPLTRLARELLRPRKDLRLPPPAGDCAAIKL